MLPVQAIMPAPELEFLPNDVIERILGFLPINDQKKVFATSAILKKYCLTLDFAREEFPETNRIYSCVKMINAETPASAERKNAITSLLKRIRQNIKELRFIGGTLAADYYCEILRCCKKLESVWLTDSQRRCWIQKEYRSMATKATGSVISRPSPAEFAARW